MWHQSTKFATCIYYHFIVFVHFFKRQWQGIWITLYNQEQSLLDNQATGRFKLHFNAFERYLY